MDESLLTDVYHILIKCKKVTATLGWGARIAFDESLALSLRSNDDLKNFVSGTWGGIF
jgi:hypothetical protein